MKGTAALALLALFEVACGRHLTYADDVDVKALEATFKCGGSMSGDRAHACRILADFASAGPFESAPTKSLETWFGRKVCADAIDAPNRMDFGQVHLKPGIGTATWPDDVKTDPSKDLPFGAQFIATSVGTLTPPTLKAEYEKTVVAAEKGTTPSFDDLDPHDRDLLKLFWESVQRPPGTTLWVRLVRSNGSSLLGGAFSSDVTTKPSANYFVRGKANRMLVVYPHMPCVAELWKIHTE